MSTLYEKVEMLRREKGISQRILESELGFSNGSISKWKKSTPTIDRIQKLANYFNVPVEYLTDNQKIVTGINNASHFTYNFNNEIQNQKIGKAQFVIQKDDDNNIEETDIETYKRVKELFDLYEQATPETQNTIIEFLKASLRKP